MKAAVATSGKRDHSLADTLVQAADDMGALYHSHATCACTYDQRFPTRWFFVFQKGLEMKRYEQVTNYVPALREPPPRHQIIDIPPTEIATLPPAAMTTVEMRASYMDRAKGFQIVSVPIAIAFGVGVLVVAAVGWSVPVFSLGALAVFWLAFLGWWLLGWAIHHIASPDGIALVQALLMYKYVRNEQRERHSRYARLHDKDGVNYE
jgi:hypothetical protein